MTLLEDWLKTLQLYELDLKLMETAFTSNFYKLILCLIYLLNIFFFRTQCILKS